MIRNEKLMRLGRGTKIASTPARCIQLDFTALIKNIPAIRSVDNPPIEESDASDVWISRWRCWFGCLVQVKQRLYLQGCGVLTEHVAHIDLGSL